MLTIEDLIRRPALPQIYIFRHSIDDLRRGKRHLVKIINQMGGVKCNIEMGQSYGYITGCNDINNIILAIQMNVWYSQAVINKLILCDVYQTLNWHFEYDGSIVRKSYDDNFRFYHIGYDFDEGKVSHMFGNIYVGSHMVIKMYTSACVIQKWYRGKMK